MLVEETIHNVFGSRIQLVGCKHYLVPPSGESDIETRELQAPRSWNPEENQFARRLDDFAPDHILVEIPTMEDFNVFSGLKTDIATLHSYSEKKEVSVTPYDIRKENNGLSMEQMENIAVTDFFEEIATDTDRLSTKAVIQTRRKASREKPAPFQRKFTEREDNASTHLLDALHESDTITMHCGFAHYPVYNHLLDFLPSVRY